MTILLSESEIKHMQSFLIELYMNSLISNNQSYLFNAEDLGKSCKEYSDKILLCYSNIIEKKHNDNNQAFNFEKTDDVFCNTNSQLIEIKNRAVELVIKKWLDDNRTSIFDVETLVEIYFDYSEDFSKGYLGIKERDNEEQNILK